MSDYSLIESPNNGSSVLRRDGDNQVVVAGGLSPDEAQRLVAKLNRHTFKVGDFLEWVVTGLFIAAAYDQTKSLPLSFTVAGVCLFYLAQNLAGSEFPRPRLPRFRVKLPHISVVKYLKAGLKRKDKSDTSPRPRR